MTNSDDIAEALRSLESQAPRPDVALELVQAENRYGATRIAASKGRFTRWRTPLAAAAAVLVIGAGLTIAVAGSGRHDASSAPVAPTISAPRATISAAAVTSSATTQSASRTDATTGSTSAPSTSRPVGATDPWTIGPMPATLSFTLTPRTGWTVQPVTVLPGYSSVGEYDRAGNSIQIALISQQAFQQPTTVRGSTPATVDGHAGYLAELASTDARSTYGPNSDSPDKVRTLVMDVGSDRQLVLQGWPTATDAQLLAAAHRVTLTATPLLSPFRFTAPLAELTVFGFTNGGPQNAVWLAPPAARSWTDQAQVSLFGLTSSGFCALSQLAVPTTRQMTAPGETPSDNPGTATGVITVSASMAPAGPPMPVFTVDGRTGCLQRESKAQSVVVYLPSGRPNVDFELVLRGRAAAVSDAQISTFMRGIKLAADLNSPSTWFPASSALPSR